MNVSVRPHTLIAHILPGFVVLGALFIVYGGIGQLSDLAAPTKSLVAFVPFALAISWATGLFLDAVRNSLEYVLECVGQKVRCRAFGKIEWRVFMDATAERVDRLMDFWYSYYVLDGNLALGLLLFVIVLRVRPPQDPPVDFSHGLPLLAVIVAVVLLCIDFGLLRGEIVELTGRLLSEEGEKPPHYGVYTRLGRSDLHGIGVFAICDIKEGTPIFYGDEDLMRCVDAREVRRLPKEVRKLYDDFCVIRGDRYWCPKNFNQLTPAWYLNSSKEPNVRCDEKYQFYALRDIKAGDELTVDYDTYSDRPREE